MPLFQNSVLNKYLKGVDSAKADKAWTIFTAHFHNPEIQENIRNSKEEQYQGEFLIDLFVKVFGYVKNPNPDFNLTTELKNIKGAKKTDGAILQEDKAMAVIELKGTNTVDLSKVETQAFGYKNNQPGCKYVITSNFEKLRFYIDNAVDYEEFNLFLLTRERFNTLYLCLSAEKLLKDIPKQIKDESLSQEENVTKQLYKDYSQFRNEIFDDIQKHNPNYDKLTLFKKTQKLLDRFLFIFFAEDRLLLPPNSITQIVTQWTDLRDKYDEYQPLYSRFKKYFGYMNTGYEGKKYDIFAYNGGLFSPDEVLDSIVISDDLLHRHTVKLSNYDFESEVSVNILGHIFEHSLTEIETIQAQLEGTEIDKSKTKRKKDGVFYTPKYITKYIVDNTVGKLCEEKKTEIGFDEKEFEKDRKGRKKAKLKELVKQLDDYREWLLQITICDPACGSGAFLNQALEFLIEEHHYIDELKAKVLGGGIVFTEVQNDILENNIFGVDINEESVEIAKLSLWLRTAKKGRKLSTLNSNIKCGNSLIDDVEVAGDKAFSWKKEFPEIFSRGGFDVVIGNPPYGASLDYKDWLKVRFKETSFGNIDSYKYFTQLGSELLCDNGILGYIMPDSFLEKEYFKDLRTFISKNFLHVLNIKLGDDIFDDVNLPTAITLLFGKNNVLKKYGYKDISKYPLIDKPFLLQNKANFIEDLPIYEKSFIVLNSIISDTIKTTKLIEVYDQVMGVKVYQKGKGRPKQTSYEKENDVFVSKINNNKFDYPYISQGIGRYKYTSKNEFISYGEWLAEPRKENYFDNPKVIIREIVNPRIYATYIDFPAIVKNIAAVIIERDSNYPLLFLLALINSKLFTYYIDEQSPKSGNKSYPSFNSRLLKGLPIIDCSIEIKKTLGELAKIMLTKTENLNKNIHEISSFITIKLEASGPSQKLKTWNELDVNEFLKEIEKVRKNSAKERGVEYIKLSLSDEADWMQYFNEQKQKVDKLKEEVNKTDSEIDKIVYKLYCLTNEEIILVQESII